MLRYKLLARQGPQQMLLRLHQRDLMDCKASHPVVLEQRDTLFLDKEVEEEVGPFPLLAFGSLGPPEPGGPDPPHHLHGGGREKTIVLTIIQPLIRNSAKIQQDKSLPLRGVTFHAPR
jgi:hypothetical protein